MLYYLYAIINTGTNTKDKTAYDQRNYGKETPCTNLVTGRTNSYLQGLCYKQLYTQSYEYRHTLTVAGVSFDLAS